MPYRSWCPDRTLSQARKYIAESLGPSYAEGVILDLEKTWEETDERTPLICFLSMGSDPTNSIESLAKRHKLGITLSSNDAELKVSNRKQPTALNKFKSKISFPAVWL